MKLIDKFDVVRPHGVGSIELYVGDLAAIPDAYAVDALVVSAFPNDYKPSPGTLIAALHDRGVSVAELARRKEQDLRATTRCWLSEPVDPSHNFRHVVCFEPRSDESTTPSMVVEGLFRCLVPLVAAEPWISTVATPMLATGDQAESPTSMLTSMLNEAVRWLSSGLGLTVFRIVLRDGKSSKEIDNLAQIFRAVADRATAQQQSPLPNSRADFEHDIFVSYAHANASAVDQLVQRIAKADSLIRIYRDTSKLNSGDAWQQSLFSAIDASRFVLPVYSRDYLKSKVCIEELHIGWMRHREHGDVLLPALLESVDLPTYMRLIQYTDVREADPKRIDELAEAVAMRVGTARDAPHRSRTYAGTPPQTTPSSITLPADTVAPLVERLGAGEEINLDVTIRLRDR